MTKEQIPLKQYKNMYNMSVYTIYITYRKIDIQPYIYVYIHTVYIVFNKIKSESCKCTQNAKAKRELKFKYNLESSAF